MSFSFQTGSSSGPPALGFQVRNGGAGTLNWSLTATTSDGGNWLSTSASSGTAPTMVMVTLNKQNLPGAGITAGTFVGNLTLQASGSSVTIPVSVAVGESVISQVNAISFTKVFGGANPLPQTLTMASTGASVGNFVHSYTAGGGTWLSTGGCSSYCGTPNTVTAIVNPDVTLAQGTYTGEIVVTQQDGSTSITVPVTLTVAPVAGAYFDNVPGQISFSIKTSSGSNPPPQSVGIRNAGSGFLDWTLTAVTADGGN